MDEEKPAVTEIPPLRWPEGIKLGPRGHRLSSVRSKDKSKILEEFEKQVAVRPPIPPEVWGHDLRRRDMAAIVCGFLDKKLWFSDKFLPEDLVEIVFSGEFFGDDVDDYFEKIEEEVLFRDWLDKDEECPDLKTLGELVDFCLARADYWSVDKWTPDPAGKICPTFSAFYDIRRFVCSRYSLDHKSVSPSTQLSACRFGWGIKVYRDKWQYLNNYLSKRFGKDEVLSDRFLGVFPEGWSWLFLTVGSYFFGITCCDASWIGWWILLLFLFTGIIVGLLSWPKWRKGLRTFRDLVEYVVAEGNVDKATPQASK